MAFPDNQFEQDVLDDLYGGRPGTELKTDNWTFLSGLVRAIAKRFLSHIRVPWSVQCVVVQETVQPGDCIGQDLSKTVVADGSAWIGKMSTIGSTNAVFLGVATEVIASGKRGMIAGVGPLPVSITGLTGTIPAKSPISVDFIGNKLKLWVAGDDPVGYADPGGNVLITAAGHVA